ncbi:hypothetical protein N2152v2_000960 [Parachlorella kessleri]
MTLAKVLLHSFGREHLKVTIGVPGRRTKDAAVPLLAFAGLTCLELRLAYGSAPLHLQLAELPALAELHLSDYTDKVALRASKPAPRLLHLSCLLGQLSADFAMLPGLKTACFASFTKLDCVANIAAATALTCLQLCEWNTDWEHSSGMELLRTIPSSVKCLALEGDWSEEVAALVGQQTGLEALALRGCENYDPVAPPAGAPVWAGLRAFSWTNAGDSRDRLNLPLGLCQASRLEALQCHVHTYTMEDMELLCSLPALKKLILAPYEWWDDGHRKLVKDPHGAIVRCIARRALPGVYVEEVDEARKAEQLLEWALM